MLLASLRFLTARLLGLQREDYRLGVLTRAAYVQDAPRQRDDDGPRIGCRCGSGFRGWRLGERLAFAGADHGDVVAEDSLPQLIARSQPGRLHSGPAAHTRLAGIRRTSRQT